MKRWIGRLAFLIAATLGAAPILVAFSTRDKEGLIYLMAGGVILLTCFMAACVLLQGAVNRRESPNPVLMGFVAGAVAGSLLGATGVLWWMIGPLKSFFAYALKGLPGILVGGALGSFVGSFAGFLKQLRSPSRTS